MRLQRWPDKMICSVIFFFIFGAVLAAEEESRSSYIVAQENKRLHGYTVKRIDSTDEMACIQVCLRHSWCTSSNFKESSGNCELNKHEFSITVDDDTKLTDNTGTTFSMFLMGCLMAGCLNGGSCLFDKEKDAFACSCNPQWSGEKCELDTDECAKNTHKCGANAYCNNTKGGYNCTCHPGYYGDGKNCEPAFSCKDIFDKKISNESKAYPLIMGNRVIKAYCYMTVASTENETCGNGAWTLVMKTDGTKQTFHYDSDLWNNSKAFNLDGGKTGFDLQETKLPSYWNTSLSKICLGMKINNQINFIVINKQANSLYSLIADGQYRSTSLGRDKWMSLIGSDASLQLNCKKEGFNAKCSLSGRSKARIGILGNHQADCHACNSRLGFGSGGNNDDRGNTCGNLDNHKHKRLSIKTMGYILVQ